MFAKVIRIGLILFFSVNVFAGKIDKAYEALKIYDYFKAKTLFQEMLDDEPVPARYGLTIIYYRKDNPLHNLDTAYAYINKVEIDFEGLRNKYKKNLLEYSIDEEHILELKSNIILSFWNNVEKKNSVRLINSFIEKFPNFYDIEKVKQIRTDLAYDKAEKQNTFQSYGSFFNTYPGDYRSEEAKIIYEKKLYEAKTHKGNLQSYIDFIYIYPENPYVINAEDEIFLLATKNKTAKRYKWFLDEFPNNPNTSEAWKNLFVLSFTDFNDLEIREFIQENDNFPYPDDFIEFRVLRDLNLYKISKGGKWGFIDDKGVAKIEAQYEFENDFSNEYALVANEDFVGYINKKGEQVIDFVYDDGGDFIEGVANVTRGDSVALINKLGNTVLDFEFSEISNAKDGLVLAKKVVNGKYQYYSILGKELFKGKEFDYAQPFNNGFAIVGDENYYGVINDKGKIVIKIDNKEITRDIKNRFRVQDANSKYGLISASTLDTIIPFVYSNIGKYSEGKYSVFLEEKYGYLRENGDTLTKFIYYRFENDVNEVNFKNGYAVTNIRGKYGVIDSLGNKIFPTIFEEIGDFVDYPVPCKKRGKWGFVTKKITMWLPYKYSSAGAFYNGQAIVAKGGKSGVINSKKKIVIPFKYEDIDSFKEEYYLVLNKNKYGVLDNKGKVILPFYYSKIKEFEGDVILLNYNDEVFYYNIKRKIFIYGSFPK